MPEVMPATREQIARQFADFRTGQVPDRFFSCSIRSGEMPDGMCYCDAPLLKALVFYARSALLLFLLKLPFNSPKLWMLRRCGAKIGPNVHISTDVWIDPLFVDLLEIESEALIGVGAKLVLHEFTNEKFRAGRITIRHNAVIGAFAVLGPGLEIGNSSIVARGAVVIRDVPAGATVVGNPARILRRPVSSEVRS